MQELSVQKRFISNRLSVLSAVAKQSVLDGESVEESVVFLI